MRFTLIYLDILVLLMHLQLAMWLSQIYISRNTAWWLCTQQPRGWAQVLEVMGAGHMHGHEEEHSPVYSQNLLSQIIANSKTSLLSIITDLKWVTDWSNSVLLGFNPNLSRWHLGSPPHSVSRSIIISFAEERILLLVWVCVSDVKLW